MANTFDGQGRAIAPPPGTDELTRFIARQPIFDRDRRVIGYELLFRQSEVNAFDGSDPDAATRSVITDAMLLHGLNTLTGPHKAFINFSANLLGSDCALVLPKDRTVIEILETVEPSPDVLASCLRLKEAGYCLALDDVGSSIRPEAFQNLVDIIKVDLRCTSPEQRRLLVARFVPREVVLLAEKVETYAEFDLARRVGFQLFQGYFFSKPQIISSRELPALQVNYLRILEAVQRPVMNMEEIERIIKSEPALCFKLLRYLNSAFFSFSSSIRSIRHAISLLGEEQFRAWVSLLAVTLMSSDKPQELVVSSLVRAALCESLAPEFGLQGREGDLFLLGLFSQIDAIVDRPLKDLLDQLPLSEEIRVGLLLEDSPLADVLRVVQSYEKGDWDRLADLVAYHRLNESKIPDAYIRAVEWTQRIFETMPEESPASSDSPFTERKPPAGNRLVVPPIKRNSALPRKLLGN